MQDTIFNIIDVRCSQKKPLIVTANSSMEPQGSPQSKPQTALDTG
jgi:hypothetical protein